MGDHAEGPLPHVLLLFSRFLGPFCVAARFSLCVYIYVPALDCGDTARSLEVCQRATRHTTRGDSIGSDLGSSRSEIYGTHGVRVVVAV